MQVISDDFGADRVGIRLTPFITHRDMNDSELIVAILMVTKRFNQISIAYIHLAEADWDDAPVVSDQFRHSLRDTFDSAIIVAGNYTAESRNQLIKEGLVDFIAFGRKFLANPDLPYRIQNNVPLNEIGDHSTLFGGDEYGYTDYLTYTT